MTPTTSCSRPPAPPPDGSGRADRLGSAVPRVTGRRLGEDVVQTQSGCVAPLCGAGPVVCCYPSGAWYAGVGEGDVAEIVRTDLAGGGVVVDLMAARVEGCA